MQHVDDGVLHAYLDGELVGAERDQVLAHLGACATCRDRLEEERALQERASELLARAAPPPPRRTAPPFPRAGRAHAPSWRIPVAWAATVTIAFAVGWYAQGERVTHEVAGDAPRSVAAAPTSDSPRTAAKAAPTPRRATEQARVPRRPPAPRTPPAMAAEDAVSPAAAAREESAPALAAGAATQPAKAAARSDAEAPWITLDADGARALLGQAPALLPGHPVRRMARSPTEDGVLVVEQEWKPGIVLRLYQRRALDAGYANESRQGAERGRAAPRMSAAQPSEHLARYVRSLRVEIAGPLASDSLARILDAVE